jgi:hypothetical protein
MKSTGSMIGALAVLAWGAAASPANAAWNNVFQVCCNSCGGQTSASFYAPSDPCCNPCPQVCTTRYVQRTFYQPVTTMVTRSYFEPVTTYRTSFYYEPVTTYRYTSFFDPCTCSWQQKACPTTCYQLRSQCCPVQSWVQRCCSQPVTTYRQCSYWEPVTSCCTPTAPACPPNPCPPAAATASPGVSATSEPPAAAQPGVNEQRSQPSAGVRENSDRGNTGSGSPLFDRYYPPSGTQNSPSHSGSSRRLQPQPQPLPVRPPAPVPAQNAAPRVKLEQIVSANPSGPGVRLASGSTGPQWTPKR